MVVLSERLAETAGDARIVRQRGLVRFRWTITTGPVRVRVIRARVSPTSELPDSDTVPRRAPRLVWPDRLAIRIASPRVSDVDRDERVADGRLAPVAVLEWPRHSASADVRDGLDGLGRRR